MPCPSLGLQGEVGSSTQWYRDGVTLPPSGRSRKHALGGCELPTALGLLATTAGRYVVTSDAISFLPDVHQPHQLEFLKLGAP